MVWNKRWILSWFQPKLLIVHWCFVCCWRECPWGQAVPRSREEPLALWCGVTAGCGVEPEQVVWTGKGISPYHVKLHWRLYIYGAADAWGCWALWLVVGEDLQCWWDVGQQAVVLLAGHQSLGGEQLHCIYIYRERVIIAYLFPSFPFCLSK